MAHFAEIDENNIVLRVIVAEQSFIDSGIVGNPASWIQTSYNTRANTHPENKPLRKNYAGIGYYYDSILDAFIPPKPYESWILNTETGLWEPPISYPEDGNSYEWDEQNCSWKLIQNL